MGYAAESGVVLGRTVDRSAARVLTICRRTVLTSMCLSVVWGWRCKGQSCSSPEDACKRHKDDKSTFPYQFNQDSTTLTRPHLRSQKITHRTAASTTSTTQVPTTLPSTYRACACNWIPLNVHPQSGGSNRFAVSATPGRRQRYNTDPGRLRMHPVSSS